MCLLTQIKQDPHMIIIIFLYIDKDLEKLL